MDTFLIDYRTHIQDVVVAVVCLSALVWGGSPERCVAATWLIVFDLGGLVQNWLFGEQVQLTSIDWFVASSDTVALLVLTWVALNANRNYTLWIAAMQVLAITAHLARSLADLISPIAYAVMFIAPGWIQLLLLGIGVARHVQRKRNHGEYRDWRVSKPSIGIGGNPGIPQGEVALQQGAQQPSWRNELK